MKTLGQIEFERSQAECEHEFPPEREMFYEGDDEMEPGTYQECSKCELLRKKGANKG